MSWQEKDLEDWIAEDVSRISTPSARLLGRQVNTGAGILDLLIFEPGSDRYPHRRSRLTVVELKAVPVTTSAVAQVCRYMNNLDTIYPDLPNEDFPYSEFRDHGPDLHGLLVGPSLTDEAAEIVIAAANLSFLSVEAEVRFAVSFDAVCEIAVFERPEAGLPHEKELVHAIRAQVGRDLIARREGSNGARQTVAEPGQAGEK